MINVLYKFYVCFVFLMSVLMLGNSHLRADKAAAAKVILFLGDSLTEGFGIEKDKSFPELISKKIQTSKFGQGYTVVQSGIGGSTSAGAKARLKWHLKVNPSIVILALGANDGLRGLDVKELEKNLSSTIELAQSKKVKVILAGMKMPPNYGKSYTDSFEKVFEKLAKKYSLVLVPFLLEGVAGNKSLNLPDGIHPNAKGHEIIADTVWKYLEPML